ncbi:MAG: type I secretion system permease/ATPase [Campylobacterota bacterium]|nr:type I secretion system permease/ATPase [Campylobacterota bacterium]
MLASLDNVKFDALLETLVLYTKLYDKPYTAEALTAGLPISPDESTPELFSINKSKGLFSRAAAKAGMKSSIFKRPLDTISPLQLPVIILLANQGACILDSIDEKTGEATIFMPSEEPVPIVIDFDMLESQYIGFGFLVKKNFEFAQENKKTLNLKQKHWFWSTIALSKGIYRDVLFAALLVNLFVLATPLFTMNVYDRVVPNNAVETLWVFAVGVVIIYTLDIFLKLTRSYLLESAAKKSDIIMSSILFDKVLSLKMANSPQSIGSFANTIRDFDSIRGFLTNATMTALVDLPFTIIFLAVIAYIGGVIVLIPLVTVVIILGYAYFVKKPLRASIESTHEAQGKKNAVLIETLGNLETIKSMSTEGRSQWKWEETIGEIATKSVKSRLLSATIPTITQFLIQINSVGMVVAGVYLIKEHELTMGGLIAIVLLTGRTLAPLGQATGLMTNYEDTKQAYDAINNIIDMPSERPDGKQFVTTPDFTGNIEFKDVTFTYPDADMPALKNVSFVVKSGEKIGIIGRIGSGKSTIEKLMLGLYEPDSGSILVDGLDINQIDPADLRKNISYVSQDTMLFKGTVKENIIYRASHVNDAAMIKAAQISAADQFIKRHPKGYDMPIGERGVGLSGGQRQSIGISRAFLFPTPMIILDEPTSSMDQLTESLVMKNIADATKHQNLIIVTQKMVLLNVVDRVIVMHEGKVYLDGPKDEVLTKMQKGS